MAYLQAFVELFRFVKRYRLRETERLNAERAERAAERLHQLEMVKTIFGSMVELSRENAAPIHKLAEAQSASAEVLSAWLKGFHIADPSPAPPQVADDEQEWKSEQLKELAEHLPPEFKLAFDLDKLNQESLDAMGFDREGSDF
jgi:hypothetical protein